MQYPKSDVEAIARAVAGIVMVPEFSMEKIPVKLAAKIYGKSETWVRKGILEGWLPIGHATESEHRINVYISPKKLWEDTGFIWKGESDEKSRETEAVA